VGIRTTGGSSSRGVVGSPAWSSCVIGVGDRVAVDKAVPRPEYLAGVREGFARPRAASTRRSCCREVLRMVPDYAVRARAIGLNPCDGVRVPGSTREEAFYLTEDFLTVTWTSERARGRTRTDDLTLTRRLLWPTELLGQICGP
jgi:hypothetical protein